ncbi:vacuolar membrane protein-domain-containing protein [Dichotomocladium elegans]|nr:vacuolar membrane protein-domain-containing protein [Dichotomocladium elegans]
MRKNESQCRLLDGFAILVQLTLVLTALFALLVKRWRERPQRPFRIWTLDVSKQFIGAGMVHLLNLGISYMASHQDGREPTNLCVWYFLSLLIDTTAGIVLFWFWLRMLERMAIAVDKTVYLDSYGPPPLPSMLQQWSVQTSLFLIATLLTKICIYGVFVAIPQLFVFGDWVLHLLPDDAHHQVVFVMFVFPLVMNAFQFCVVDSIVKGTSMIPEKFQSSKKYRPSKEGCSPLLPQHINENTPLIL